MIFSYSNVQQRTSVYDCDSVKEIKDVKQIDTQSGELIVFARPLIVNHLGEAKTQTIKFRSIYPIYGGYRAPCLFHCYGRLN